MPTYNAGDVTARLSVVDDLDKTTGGEHVKKIELDRIQAELKTGTPLEERLIRANDHKILHFIGEEQLMRFMMVEAYSVASQKTAPVTPGKDSKAPTPKPDVLPGPPDDSPLTSTAATPTLASSPSVIPRPRQVLIPPTHSSPVKEPDTAASPTNSRPGRKALVLTLNTTAKTHLPLLGSKDSTGRKDRRCKIEIFFNGKHVQSTLIDRRKLYKNKDVQVFAGTRTGRVEEEPWTHRETSHNGSGGRDRWNAVNARLVQDSIEREDAATVSSKYLAALSKVEFPADLEPKGDLGIIDVIITVGYGGKQEGFWIEEPDLMFSRLSLSRLTRRIPVSKERGATNGVEAHAQLAGPSDQAHKVTESNNSTTPNKLSTPTPGNTPTAGPSSQPAGAPSQPSPAPTPQRRSVRTPVAKPKFGETQATPESSSRPSKRRKTSAASSNIVIISPGTHDKLRDIEMDKLEAECAIGHAAGRKRPVPEARPKRFDERDLVVGIRFLVA